MITVSVAELSIAIGSVAGLFFIIGSIMVLNQGRYSNRDSSSSYMSEASRRYQKQGHGK